MIKSDRGIELILDEYEFMLDEYDRGTFVNVECIITVENYTKWYCLYKVYPSSGRVERVEYHDLPYVQGQSQYVDHVPNPACVQMFLEEQGVGMPEAAFERIIGRWVWEVLCWGGEDLNKLNVRGIND